MPSLVFNHKSDDTIAKTHFCALYNQTSAPVPKASGGYDCGCRGKCPSGPTPGPTPAKPGHCNKLQGWSYNDPNISITSNVEMIDCCTICNRTQGCAVAVWVPNKTGIVTTTLNDRGVLVNVQRSVVGKSVNGTCITKSSRLSPVNSQYDSAVSWLPAGVPVPPPVITEQAGIVIGDMKIVVGVSVSQSVFTGPQYVLVCSYTLVYLQSIPTPKILVSQSRQCHN